MSDSKANKSWFARAREQLGGRSLLGLFWLLHWLPLPLLAALGQGLGQRVLWPLARSRRRIVLTNLRLCFPELDDAARRRLGREHMGWLARSLLERSLLLYASPQRLRRLIQVEGDLQLAQRSGVPSMWMLPHFVALDFIAPPLTLEQQRSMVSIYQTQPNPVMDEALRRVRLRLGSDTLLVDRSQGVRPVVRAIHKGAVFINASDMDFGRQDSAFVPFFGVATSTLLSPARLACSLGLQVQILVVEMLPRGRGYRLHVHAMPEGFDDPDPLLATAAWNRWLETLIRQMPAQYYWVHRRFKTRPEGEAKFY
jgi:KDO2-lipid IV(A) lauroyltransferase